MDENFLEFAGSIYYIDLDAFDKKITVDSDLDKKTATDTVETSVYDAKGNISGTEKTTTITEKHKEMNIATYETLRMFLEIMLTYSDDDIDDTLGAQRALGKGALSFKIAFNTLLRYGILKEL